MTSSGAGPSRSSGMLSSYLSHPLSSCMPSSSRHRLDTDDDDDERHYNPSERSTLLHTEASYDDSDAISLLSNIASRDAQSKSRRRRRARIRKLNQRSRQSGLLGLGDLASTLLACGLFGRRGQEESSDDEQPQQRGHNRTQSQDSINTITSTDSIADRHNSGEEDAGSLAEDTIARLGQQEQQQEDVVERGPTEEEVAQQQAKEEEALAAQEEEALEKARRKAERKALRKQQQQNERDARAEAAAGGFDDDDHQQYHGYSHGYHDGQEQQYHEQMYRDQEGYGDWHAPQEDYYAHPHAHHGNEASYDDQPVIHHHHYYTEEEAEPPSTLSPSALTSPPVFSPSALPALPSPSEHEEATLKGEEVDEEDEADMAGLGLGRRRSKKGASAGAGTGSQGSGSQSRHSYTQRATARSNSSMSDSKKYLSPSLADSTAHRSSFTANSSTSSHDSDKPSYRNRPRRHERTGSRSTNTSSSGGRTRIVDGSNTLLRGTSPILPEEEGDFTLPGGTDETKADAAAGGFDNFEPPQEDPLNSGRTSPRKMSYKEKRAGVDSFSNSSSERYQRRQTKGQRRKDVGNEEAEMDGL
ncbi:unnamed protein product [Sympodiomycopsis kandeliae]